MNTISHFLYLSEAEYRYYLKTGNLPDHKPVVTELTSDEINAIMSASGNSNNSFITENILQSKAIQIEDLIVSSASSGWTLNSGYYEHLFWANGFY